MIWEYVAEHITTDFLFGGQGMRQVVCFDYCTYADLAASSWLDGWSI